MAVKADQSSRLVAGWRRALEPYSHSRNWREGAWVWIRSAAKIHYALSLYCGIDKPTIVHHRNLDGGARRKRQITLFSVKPTNLKISLYALFISTSSVHRPSLYTECSTCSGPNILRNLDLIKAWSAQKCSQLLTTEVRQCSRSGFYTVYIGIFRN